MRCPRAWLRKPSRSGGAGPRPPATKSRALGASSRRVAPHFGFTRFAALKSPVRGERGPDAVTDTAAERRRARALFKRQGAPRLKGRGSELPSAFSALRSPHFFGGRLPRAPCSGKEKETGAPAPQRIGAMVLAFFTSPHPTSGLPEFGQYEVVEVGHIRLRLGRGRIA
jgi:hypothetical protein